jgi:hypothetical protein
VQRKVSRPLRLRLKATLIVFRRTSIPAARRRKREERRGLTMANKFFIQSLLGDLVVDISEKGLKKGEIPPATTALDAFTTKKTDNDNQLWTFVPGPNPGYFFIQNPASNLVIDISEKGLKAGQTPPANTDLDAFTMKASDNPNNANQLWELLAGPADKPDYFFLRSLMGDLVVDIRETGLKKGEIPPAATALDAFTNKGGDNQLWTLKSAPGNSFKPKLTGFTPVIELTTAAKSYVTVAGTGFRPGATLVFQSALKTGFGLAEPPPLHGMSDLDGNVLMPATMIAWGLAEAGDGGIVNQLGTFTVAVSYNSGPVVASASAQWNGIVFSDFPNG